MLDAIKKLREKTNAGVVDCQKALKEANGDTDKAIEILRKRGVALATKKVGRQTKEGRMALAAEAPQSRITGLLTRQCLMMEELKGKTWMTSLINRVMPISSGQAMPRRLIQ